MRYSPNERSARPWPVMIARVFLVLALIIGFGASFAQSAVNPPIVSGATPTKDATPRWTWTSGGGGNGIFRYRLDNAILKSGATETRVRYYLPTVPLANGFHTLYVQERDQAGNWSLKGKKLIVIDMVKPGAPVVEGITPTRDTAPRWTWTSGGGGSGTFRYKLDSSDSMFSGATETSANYYVPVAPLGEGRHILYVQERDEAGNWSLLGSKVIVIDMTAPQAPLVRSITPTRDTTPTWSWSTSGGGNGSFRYSLDNPNMTFATRTTSRSYTPATALAVGSHTLYVQERDQANRWWSPAGSKSILIKATPLGAPWVSGISPTKDATPTWGWGTGGGGNGTFRYNLDNPDMTAATSTTDRSYTPLIALDVGTHTLYVQECDQAGLWSPVGSKAIVIEANSLGTPEVSGVTPTSEVRPTWGWRTGGGGNGYFRYNLDSPDMTWAELTTKWYYVPATALNEGDHTLYVQESDMFGNWSTTGQFTIEVQSPTFSAIPDTGQIQSYTDTFGEDSDYTINLPSYSVIGDGTVIDNVTALIWQRGGDSVARSWGDAVSYCENLDLAGYTDWQLPTKKKLMGIVNYGVSFPSIDQVAFPDTKGSYYWTSTADVGYPGDAWYVSFRDGSVASGTIYIDGYTRCVRGGQ